MEIVDLTPVHDPGGRDVALFAVKPTPDLKLCGLRLRRRADGSYGTIPPRAYYENAMHFAPALYKQITAAATEEFERLYAVDCYRN